MAKLNQGYFKPKNPQKYKGDPTNIIYRSGWELKLMIRLDDDPRIIQWSSEEVIIPYRSPIDNRIHRYYVDFWVKKDNGEVLLVEVKPHKQTQEPKIQKSKSKKYINEVVTWGINSAKWSAAEEYCKDRKWKFIIMTEHELGIKF